MLSPERIMKANICPSAERSTVFSFNLQSLVVPTSCSRVLASISLHVCHAERSSLDFWILPRISQPSQCRQQRQPRTLQLNYGAAAPQRQRAAWCVWLEMFLAGGQLWTLELSLHLKSPRIPLAVLRWTINIASCITVQYTGQSSTIYKHCISIAIQYTSSSHWREVNLAIALDISGQ